MPADARLIEENGLRVEESALTGEATASEKNADSILAPDTPLAERENMIFASTTVTAGNCTAIVTQTGMDTQVGKIAALITSEKAPPTPLQQRLARVGKVLAFGALIICALVFLLSLARSQGVLGSFMLAVSLAVAAIPEGLPAIVTVVLSVGVQRMAKSNAVIRHLPAVETLGAATVICSDKTGTLTQNKMTVTRLFTCFSQTDFNSRQAEKLLTYASVCCNCEITATSVTGEPTETAIVSAAQKSGIDIENIHKKHPRIHENPFDSKRKMMSTLNRTDGGNILIVKGAPDILLKLCDFYYRDGANLPLTQADREKISAANKKMADDALRVIAVAFRNVHSSTDTSEKELTFMGLIGMYDPPREEVLAAVRCCRQAGITPIVITGDHAATAAAVAKQLEISDKTSTVITGEKLDSMTQEKLIREVENCRVFARVTPEHKVRIVKAFRARGETVAMTGDGVNDAPALKAADIGCAMGRGGTEVAKSAADMVLADDNFATIVKAVEQGRGIYDNIKKAVHFLLSSNIGEILAIFVSTLMGFPAPLLPIQLLWVNLVTDSLPAMSLGMEAIEKDVMRRKPTPASKSFFADGLWLDIMLEGFFVGVLTLFAFCAGCFMFESSCVEVGRTMAFATLSLCEISHAISMRSHKPIFKVGFFSNKRMAFSAIICTALQLAVMLIPAFAQSFKVVPLGRSEWFTVALLSLAPLIIGEITKLFKGK